MKIRPLHDRVVIKRLEETTKTAGGIIIPDTAKEKPSEGIVEAVHKLVAKSKSKVVMLQLEDIMGVDKLQNLPGTDRDKYPNWRLKLPIDLEDLENLHEYERNIKAIKSIR